MLAAMVCFRSACPFGCALEGFLAGQMAEHKKESEVDLSDLPTEYWTFRYETGKSLSSLTYRSLHGDASKWIEVENVSGVSSDLTDRRNY